MCECMGFSKLLLRTRKVHYKYRHGQVTYNISQWRSVVEMYVYSIERQKFACVLTLQIFDQFLEKTPL